MGDRRVDVAVIGAGTAGISAFREAKKHCDSVVLIEGGAYGTVCARVGCMPSKLLIAAAEAAQRIREADVFGVRAGPPEIDGEAVMQRVQAERDRFVGHVLRYIDSLEPAERCDQYVRFLAPDRLQAEDGSQIRADRVIIATGTTPSIPPLLAPAGDRVITTDQIFELPTVPESVAVFGPGVIGLELGQALHRLGCRVRIFGIAGRIGPLSDPDVEEDATKILGDELPMSLRHELESVALDDTGVRLQFREADESREEHFEYILAATGRRPSLEKLELENADIALDAFGIPMFDPFTLRCGESSIFIAGDINRYEPVLHEAAWEGKIAGYNAGRYPEIRAQHRKPPLHIVFADPQIASIGTPFAKLPEEGFAVGTVSFYDQGRSRVMAVNRGTARVYGEWGTGRLLGAELVGPSVEHLAHLLAWSLEQQMTVHDVLEMPIYHPVIEEGLRTALRELQRNLAMGPPLVPRCLDCGPGG